MCLGRFLIALSWCSIGVKCSHPWSGGISDSTIEALTKYNDEECRYKPEKVAISEGIYVAVPESVEQVVQPIKEEVPTPSEEAAHVVPLPPTGEKILIPVPEPVFAAEPITEPPKRRFLHWKWGTTRIVYSCASPGQSWYRNTSPRARRRCASFCDSSRTRRAPSLWTGLTIRSSHGESGSGHGDTVHGA
jgi:hypothetical protein